MLLKELVDHLWTKVTDRCFRTTGWSRGPEGCDVALGWTLENEKMKIEREREADERLKKVRKRDL